MEAADLWKRYKKHLVKCPSVGMTLDVSRMSFRPRYLSKMEPAIQHAYGAMDALEGGAIANPDEGRMVGHYWLRDADRAPTAELKKTILDTLASVKKFAADVHAKAVAPPTAQKFTDVLSIGIGGSALGPQLVSDALGSQRDKLRVHFLDNTDEDGIRRVLASLGARLKSTLVLVISKSGGTPETRNGMLAAQAAFTKAGLDFAKQAVAITGVGSKLDKVAVSEGWLARFPMEDWVGGRTSLMSAVGLVPMALQGLDIDGFLDGAKSMDELTRSKDTAKNPAAMLALMWYDATNGQGEKDMVILPYKDRLLLMSRYLQQLVMESLGKKLDRSGEVVHQGIAVYGNKGSTDQHAYVQQLRDGVNNFFATFIVVLEDVPRPGAADFVEVEPSVTSGDYLTGFWQGTRSALYEEGRGSILITLDKLDAKVVGALIALYERAVGYYAELVDINAYHQPGVEAGKKAAASVLEVQEKLVAHLKSRPNDALLPEEIAQGMGMPDAVETVFHVAEHLSANKRLVRRVRSRYQAI
ncbi:MAG: glucose-6-phosphate isomerase [Planctomycetota bacterium]